eukprot:PhF_6_TR32934/c0_g1_i1/m.48409
MANRVNKLQQETKTAMQELVGELDRTRKEYAKATLQVTQLETLVEHMRDSEQKKDAVVQHLESELESVRKLHQQEVAVLAEEFRTKETGLQHTIQHLQLELNRLTEENRVLAGYELESRQLREAIMESQSKMERLQQINDDLKARVKEDMRDFRTNLEQEFKKRLVESEKKFRAEAYKALSEEAKVALQGNDQLQSVLQRQNDSIESVLARCKTLESSHSKLKSEQEMSSQNLNHHVAEVTRLRKQLNDTKSKNTQLEEVLRQRKVERASLELLFIEYETARKQLARAQEKGKRYMKEAERWKARALQLSYDVSMPTTGGGGAGDTMNSSPHKGRETPNAETRISRARQQIREVEDQLRTSSRGKLRSRGARQSVTKDGVEDWSDVSDDVDLEAIQTKANITPMEILAMWNVNFESWRETGGGASPQQQISPDGNTLYDQDGTLQDDADVLNVAVPTSTSIKPLSNTTTPSVPPVRPQQPQPPQQQQQDGLQQNAQYEAPTAASQSRNRKHRLTADEQRSVAERNLSVLTQRRYRSIPPALQRGVGQYGRKEARPISMSELAVVGTDGTYARVPVAQANPLNARFVVP